MNDVSHSRWVRKKQKTNRDKKVNEIKYMSTEI